jgi:SAM-dependent methyltransferase
VHTFVEKFIVPILQEWKATRVCEIGASFGKSTEILAALPSVSVTVIDPCLDCNLETKFANVSQVVVKRGLSLEVLPTLQEKFDCILIDGDHNWFTVYQELQEISGRELLRPGGIIFLHDVDWPWGRRDMYYQPEKVPAEFRQPMDMKGVVLGQNALSDRHGFSRGVAKAPHEGGPRNGVLTAIEDFMKEHQGEYAFAQLFGDDGLGILHRRKDAAEDRRFLNVASAGAAWNRRTWPKRLAETLYHRAGRQIR